MSKIASSVQFDNKTKEMINKIVTIQAREQQDAILIEEAEMKTLQPERSGMDGDDSPIRNREESMVRTRSYPNKRSNSMKYEFLFQDEAKKNKV